MIGDRWLHGLRLICITLALGAAACANRNRTATPEITPGATAQPSSSVGSLQLRTFDTLWSIVDENYIDESFGGVDWQAVRDEFRPQVEAGLSAEAFAELLQDALARLPEGAAAWQSRADRVEADSADASRFEGIGAFIAFRAQPEPRVVLLSVMPDSPAEKAGLQAHDSILAIDGDPVKREEGQSVVSRIRGPSGSRVTLTVRSPGRSPRAVSVTRGRVTASDVLTGGSLANGAIGYLLFPAAPPDTLAEDVVRGLQGLNEQRELAGLILDLRIATASEGWPLNEMMTLFADGELGQMRSRHGADSILVAGQNISNSQILPLTIIVGPDTNGAPEIFAAALQSIGRARVVGQPTTGSVRTVGEFPLPDGSRVFVLAGTIVTPDGRDLGQVGVEPDVVVEADWDEVSVDDDLVRDAAARALRPPSR